MAGYSNYSKSNNAVEAESEGRYPLSKAARIVAKETGITIKKATSILKEIGTDEYHHSSKFYNAVDYYDTERPIEVINHMNERGIDSYDDALNDLEEIECEEEEREMKAIDERKANCEHELIEVIQTRKGGIQVVDHHRCVKCGFIPEINR